MKFEIEISDDMMTVAQTLPTAAAMQMHRLTDDLLGMLTHPEVLHAQPGSGDYTIHRVVPAQIDYDGLLGDR